MKKTIVILVAVMLMLSLAACTSNTLGEDTTPTTAATTNADPTTAPTTAAQPDTADTEAEMRELFDKHLDCMLNIYQLRTLECEDEPVSDSLYRVTDERFPTFADLETYTRSVYVKAEAEKLLFEPRFGDHVLYQDVNGVLCIDCNAVGGRGYYVNWADYTLAVDDVTDTTCHFTVTAKEEAPGDPPVITDYVCKATAVKQDGEWRMEMMVG